MHTTKVYVDPVLDSTIDTPLVYGGPQCVFCGIHDMACYNNAWHPSHTLEQRIRNLHSLASESVPPLPQDWIDLFVSALAGNFAAIKQVSHAIDTGELAEVLDDQDWGCVWT